MPKIKNGKYPSLESAAVQQSMNKMRLHWACHNFYFELSAF